MFADQSRDPAHAGRLLRPLWLLPASLAVVLATTGCHLNDWAKNGFKVGPNYARPTAAVADGWIDANDPRVRSESQDYTNWWRTFDDPVLDRLVQTASSQNLTLRAAGFRILEAQARRRIAVSLIFPQTQQATADYQRVNVSNAIANPAPDPDFDAFDAGFNLGWEVDLWGRFRRAIEEQDARLDASIEDYDDVLVILQADVALTYVQIRETEQRIAYARQNAAAQEGLYELTIVRQTEGAISELDVKQAESVWRNTAATVPRLEARRRELIHALAVLQGIPPRDLTAELGERPIPETPWDVVVGIPADLLRRRPDVRRAEREVAAQSARIGIATSDFYPAVSILGSLGWEAESGWFASDSFRGNIGPSIRWNILNYGRIRSNVVAEDARFQESIAQYEQTVLRANAEVEDGIAGFLYGQEELQQIVHAESAARRAQELAITQYREGAADYSRVLLANEFLTDSQDQLAQSQANVALNLIRIYKALGGGWTSRLVGPGVSLGGELPAPPENIPPPQPADQPSASTMPPPRPEALSLSQPGVVSSLRFTNAETLAAAGPTRTEQEGLPLQETPAKKTVMDAPPE